MKELIFKDKQKREVCEVEMFLEEYNLVASGAPWTAHEHRDHPDYVIFSHSLNQYRLVELTSVYLHDSSVEKEHRFRHEEPIDIPYDTHKLEAYKNRIVRSVERKCATFRQEFDSQIAILSLSRLWYRATLACSYSPAQSAQMTQKKRMHCYPIPVTKGAKVASGTYYGYLKDLLTDKSF
jgi:hypothetical protein